MKVRFDAGIRLGGDIAKDMIALQIGPDMPMAILSPMSGAVLAACRSSRDHSARADIRDAERPALIRKLGWISAY